MKQEKRHTTLFSLKDWERIKKAAKAKSDELGIELKIGTFIKMIIFEYLKENGL